MKTTFEAVYENGVLRPLNRPDGLAEHEQVTLAVTAENRSSSLAAVVGSIAPDAAEDMRLIIEREFERIEGFHGA